MSRENPTLKSTDSLESPAEKTGPLSSLEHIKKSLTPEIIEHARRHLKRMAGGTHQGDVEDILNNAVVRAIRGAHAYKDQANFSAWFITVARSAYMDFYRRNRLKNRHHIDEGSFSIERLASEEGSNLGELIENTLGAEYLRRSIENLSPEFKETLILLLEDLSYQEIADKLGVPIGTVMSRINRGKKKLIEMLQESSLTNSRTSLPEKQKKSP